MCRGCARAAAARKAGKGRARARTRAAAPPPRRALSPPRPQRRPAHPPEQSGKCPTRASARRAAEKRAPAAGRRQPPPPPPPPSAPSSPRSRRRPRGWGAAPRRGRRRAPSRRVCTWCGGRGQQHCEGDRSNHAPRQGGRVTPPAAEGEVADRGDADLEGGERKVCGPARKTAQLLRGAPRRFTEGSPPYARPQDCPAADSSIRRRAVWARRGRACTSTQSKKGCSWSCPMSRLHRTAEGRLEGGCN